MMNFINFINSDIVDSWRFDRENMFNIYSFRYFMNGEMFFVIMFSDFDNNIMV